MSEKNKTSNIIESYEKRIENIQNQNLKKEEFL